MATSKMPLSPAFIERVCYRLQLPREELFSLGGTDPKSEVVKLGGTFYIPKSEIQRLNSERENQAPERTGKEKNGDQGKQGSG